MFRYRQDLGGGGLVGLSAHEELKAVVKIHMLDNLFTARQQLGQIRPIAHGP